MAGLSTAFAITLSAHGEADDTAKNVEAVSVEAIVEMRDVVLQDGQPAVASPDGLWVAVVTRHASVELNHNEYSLRLYSKSAIESLFRDDSGIKHAVPFIQKQFVGDGIKEQDEHVRGLRWSLDSRQLAFIAPTFNGDAVFILDVNTDALQTVFESVEHIYAFEVSANGQRMVIAERLPFTDPLKDLVSYPAGIMSLNAAIMPAWRAAWYRQIQYWAATLHGNAVRLLKIGPPQGDAIAPQIWLSPSGQFAVARRAIVGLTDEELAAFTPASRTFEYMDDSGSSFIYPKSTFLPQFVQLDLDELSVSAIQQAPDGERYGYGRSEVLWLPDSSGYILASTFLSNGADSKKPVVLWRTADSATEQVLLKREELAAEESSSVDLDFRADHLTVSIANRKLCFRKKRALWERRSNESCGNRKPFRAAIVYEIEQDLNNPPQLVARQVSTNQSKLVFDLNPGFRNLDFGRVQEFSWVDANQRTWNGGVLFPSNYSSDRTYPLVIQMHGFNDQTFPIDHPSRISSAFPAQALASKGFVVLFLPIDYETLNDGTQFDVHRAAVDAGVRKLVDAGVVDRKRLGIIGFSATGSIVHNILLTSEHAFAAATIADSWNPSLFGYTSYLFGTLPPGMLGAERVLGATPWGHRLKEWVERDPSMHVDEIRTAIRFEQYGLYVFPYWDIYAILRRLDRPAELIIVPEGSHQLQNPRQRLHSLQGNVDWFDFWLKDQVGAAKSEDGQHQRWREMYSRVCGKAWLSAPAYCLEAGRASEAIH